MHIVEAKGILSAKNGMNLYRGYSHNYKEQSQKHRRLSGVDPQIRIPKHHET